MGRLKKDANTFESALDELNTIVDEMEQGRLNLENALKHFERGITLVRHCQEMLKAAEQKVQMLTEQGDQLTLKPYQGNDLDQ